MSKDWNGNKTSIWTTLGASNHTCKERQKDDYYATDPIAVDKLTRAVELPDFIWEPCCGEGHLSRRLKELGFDVYSTDLVDRGFGGVANFFDFEEIPQDCKGIVTNPPYKCAMECVLHALELLPENGLCCMFLKTQFLEGKRRYNELFKAHPPRFVLQFVERVLCAKNAEFDRMRAAGGSAVSFAWFVWQKGYQGDTVVKWI